MWLTETKIARHLSTYNNGSLSNAWHKAKLCYKWIHFLFSHIFGACKNHAWNPGTGCGQAASAVEQSWTRIMIILLRNSLVWLWSNPFIGPQGGAVVLFELLKPVPKTYCSKKRKKTNGRKGKVGFYKFLNFMTALQQWNVHSICWEVSTANMHWAY